MNRLVCFALIACLSQYLPAQDAKDWKQYNYDNAGWRFNRGEKTLNATNAGRLVEKWRFPGKDSAEKIGIVHATPVVVDGFVYFGTTRTNPTFYKLTPSGKLAWKYEIKSVITAEENDPYIEYGAEHVSDGVMNSALRRRSLIRCVGWPVSSSSQWRAGYAYGELRMGWSKNGLDTPDYPPPPHGRGSHHALNFVPTRHQRS